MEIIERVAQAMAEQDQLGATADGPQINRGGWRAYLPMARAAIETMREPNEKMLKADMDLGGYGYSDCECYPADPKEIWQAMIGAALNENPCGK